MKSDSNNNSEQNNLQTISTSPELKVRYKAAKGSPKGSIVFVHGICHGAWCFEYFMNFFSENGYECFALNLRGHGDNSRKGLTFATLSQYADDVAECIKYCTEHCNRNGIKEKPFLLGHSMGGAVVQKYIKEHFDEIKGVVLFASATAKRMPYFKTLFNLRKKNLRTAALKAWGFKVADKKIAGSAFFDNRIKLVNNITGYNKLLHKESIVITFVSLYLPYYKGEYNGDIPILTIGSEADSYFPKESLLKTAKVYGCTESDTKRHLKILTDLCHDMMLDEVDNGWKKSAKAVLDFMENNK